MTCVLLSWQLASGQVHAVMLPSDTYLSNSRALSTSGALPDCSDCSSTCMFCQQTILAYTCSQQRCVCRQGAGDAQVAAAAARQQGAAGEGALPADALPRVQAALPRLPLDPRCVTSRLTNSLPEQRLLVPARRFQLMP